MAERAEGGTVAEADGTWEWLDRAAQEARDTIDRIYAEGHHQLDADVTPAEQWPAGTEHAP